MKYVKIWGLKKFKMFNDIDLFKPQFVRCARDVEEIIFDYGINNYVARDKEKYGSLSFENYLKKVEVS